MSRAQAKRASEAPAKRSRFHDATLPSTTIFCILNLISQKRLRERFRSSRA
ncbi:MAG: hypothetical protein ACM37W_28280 [Actinomycetota bacterium]